VSTSAVEVGGYRVAPGERVSLAERDPSDTQGYADKAAAAEELASHRERIAELQARLYGEGRRGLLVVLQAMDTGGKDGAVKHVFKGINPQGCQVWSFKAPTTEELAHDFLWRYHAKAPERGMIGLFNRSHYEDVLVVRVKGLAPEEVWRPRYEAIRGFERNLVSEGTTVLKFFLHISKEEQKRRLESRLQDARKHWKWNSGDLADRELWVDYQRAYEDALSETSTDEAPWYVVPADKKWFRNVVLARTIADTLEAMDPQYPEPEPGLEHITVPE
jgi:PPK2 family polyphosphate:nucleotide phosphotransferase